MSEYERLRAALDKKLAADPALRAVVKRIKNGTATLTDTAEYARVLSHILGREVSANVLDLDDRAGVVTQLLHDCYEDINGIYAQAQTILDEQAGVHIRPQKPAFPAERVDQFTHSLIDPTVNNSIIKRRAKAGCETITKSYHDDCIKKNAQFRHDAGLKCYIVRIGTKCCEWCMEVAGKYEFGDQPDGIFRRHDNCDCTIIYNGQVLRGKYNSDGVTRGKTWAERGEVPAEYNPFVLTQEEAKEIERRNLAQIRGLKINNSSIDNSGRSGIIKPITVDDFELRTYRKGIEKEVEKAMLSEIQSLEKHCGVVISDIRVENIPKTSKGTEAITTEILSNGLFCIHFNENVFSGYTLDEINQIFEQSDSILAANFHEAMIHESGHIKYMKGRSPSEVDSIHKDLKKKHISGISEYAYSDGAECIAEAEIILYRGEKVPDEAMKLYNEYVLRK